MNTFKFEVAADGSFKNTVARLRELSVAGLRPGFKKFGCWEPAAVINFGPGEVFAMVGSGGAELYDVDPVEFQAVLEMLEQPLVNRIGFFTDELAKRALMMSECEDWVLDGRISSMEDGKNSPFYKSQVEFCLQRHGKL